ncbi:MAG: hypothetical protein WCA08_09635 [Desulfoferrobacter sp.]
MKASSTVYVDRGDQIYAEQVRQLFSVEHLGFIATLINSSILVLIQWPVISQRLLIVWFCTLMLITAVRYLLLRNYQKSLMLPEQINRWARLFTAGAAIS